MGNPSGEFEPASVERRCGRVPVCPPAEYLADLERSPLPSALLTKPLRVYTQRWAGTMEWATRVIEEPAAHPLRFEECGYIQEVRRIIIITAKPTFCPSHHDDADQEGLRVLAS